MIKYLALAAGLASASAVASSSLDSLEEANVVDNSKGFHGQVGLGVASVPEYLGGDDNETLAVPLINVSYNDRYYFKFNRLGAWVFKSDSGFRVGGVITKQTGFDRSDLPREYRDFGDRDDSIMAGVNMAFQQGRFSAEAGVVKDISDEAEGTKLYGQASYTFVANQDYTLTAMGRLESLDDEMVGFYYGNYQSAVNTTVSLIGTYKLSDRWTLVGVASATKLGDEISDSVIVEDDTYNMALVGATYSF